MTNNKQEDFSSILNKMNSSAERQHTAEKIMANMSAEENKRLFDILGDRDKLSAVLNSPAAQTIMQKINGQHK